MNIFFLSSCIYFSQWKQTNYNCDRWSLQFVVGIRRGGRAAARGRCLHLVEIFAPVGLADAENSGVETALKLDGDRARWTVPTTGAVCVEHLMVVGSFPTVPSAQSKMKTLWAQLHLCGNVNKSHYLVSDPPLRGCCTALSNGQSLYTYSRSS